MVDDWWKYGPHYTVNELILFFSGKWKPKNFYLQYLILQPWNFGFGFVFEPQNQNENAKIMFI